MLWGDEGASSTLGPPHAGTPCSVTGPHQHLQWVSQGGCRAGGMLRVGWEPSAPWDMGAESELMADGELGGPKRPPQNPAAGSEQRLGEGLEAWGMCRQPHGG